MKNVVFIGLVLLMTSVAVSAWSAEAEPAKRVMAWDTSALLQVPKVHPTQECAAPGMRAFFYEGVEYKGRPTRVFAYYAAPEGQPPAGGWPAVLCAHWRRRHGVSRLGANLESTWLRSHIHGFGRPFAGPARA